MTTPANNTDCKTGPGYLLGRIFGKTLPFTAIIAGLSASHLLAGDDTLMKPMMYIGGAVLALVAALVAYVSFGSSALSAFFDGMTDDADGDDGDGGD